VASSAAVCDILAQRSRPQLFSNALPPTVACSARRAVQILRSAGSPAGDASDSRSAGFPAGRACRKAGATDRSIVQRLRENTRYFRERITEAGFRPLEGESAIIPIIVGETAFAIRISERLLDEGVFVTGFGYPVVPEGTARIRVQMSAAHTRGQIDRAVEAFRKVAGEVGLL
jgi:glycine C-acetyltransferase